MSTTIIVEQRLPISILLLSRMSTYIHVFESIMAIPFFWFFPSLSPKMPERETYWRIRRPSASTHSVAPTVSTMEDTTDEEDNAMEIYEDELKARRFSILSAPMKKSKSLSLVPFARRMSLPAKRFSEHFTTTFSSPFQTPHPSPLQSPCISFFDSPLPSPVHTPSSRFEPVAYFSPPGRRSDHVHFEKCEKHEESQVVVEHVEEVEYFKEEVSSDPVIILKKVEKVKTIKRVAKKAKSLLSIRRQS